MEVSAETLRKSVFGDKILVQNLFHVLDENNVFNYESGSLLKKTWNNILWK